MGWRQFEPLVRLQKRQFFQTDFDDLPGMNSPKKACLASQIFWSGSAAFCWREFRRCLRLSAKRGRASGCIGLTGPRHIAQCPVLRRGQHRQVLRAGAGSMDVAKHGRQTLEAVRLPHTPLAEATGRPTSAFVGRRCQPAVRRHAMLSVEPFPPGLCPAVWGDCTAISPCDKVLVPAHKTRLWLAGQGAAGSYPAPQCRH